MSGRCSGRHGWERADSLDREIEDAIPLPSGKTLKSLRGAGDYIDLPEKESGKPHWQTAIRELMIAAERSGHDAGANRDAESVEPWETGADATAQGGEEISGGLVHQAGHHQRLATNGDAQHPRQIVSLRFSFSSSGEGSPLLVKLARQVRELIPSRRA